MATENRDEFIEFGDIEPDDVLDPSPPDPEILARRLIDLVYKLDPEERVPFMDWPLDDRKIWISAMGYLIEKLKREWILAPSVGPEVSPR